MEGQLIVAYGTLATAYCKLLGMVQHLQGKKEESKMPDVMVTQDVAKPREQSKPKEVVHIQKRKYETNEFIRWMTMGECGRRESVAGGDGDGKSEKLTMAP
ncbi:hypothetical protein WISP_83412 [Willisornis vidua]|uniref:Uncharacterized protein n=1 Tax=Willisornis vidua TaxID=1566151 RepID=A0ABQ9D4B2_9PASS|nr:hypothetical protein WISP_83412 [Willisornis vidua]